VPIKPEGAAKSLKPEGVGKSQEHLLYPMGVDDEKDDLSRKVLHSLKEP
jgi:hypothetical protein